MSVREFVGLSNFTKAVSIYSKDLFLNYYSIYLIYRNTSQHNFKLLNLVYKYHSMNIVQFIKSFIRILYLR